MVKHPYKTAIVEIAKIVDEYRAEDSELGRMCRKITRIIQDAECIKFNKKKTE